MTELETPSAKRPKLDFPEPSHTERSGFIRGLAASAWTCLLKMSLWSFRAGHSRASDQEEMSTSTHSNQTPNQEIRTPNTYTPPVHSLSTEENLRLCIPSSSDTNAHLCDTSCLPITTGASTFPAQLVDPTNTDLHMQSGGVDVNGYVPSGMQHWSSPGNAIFCGDSYSVSGSDGGNVLDETSTVHQDFGTRHQDLHSGGFRDQSIYQITRDCIMKPSAEPPDEPGTFDRASPAAEVVRLLEMKHYKQTLEQYLRTSRLHSYNCSRSTRSQDDPPLALSSSRRVARYFNRMSETMDKTLNSTAFRSTIPSVVPEIGIKTSQINEPTRRVLRDRGSESCISEYLDDNWIAKWRAVLKQEQERIQVARDLEKRLDEERRKEFQNVKKTVLKSISPALLREIDSVINKALKGSNPNEQLSECCTAVITRRDLLSLVDTRWLNDEVINFYLTLIVSRNLRKDYPKVYAFNTFFYPKLLSSGHVSVKRWTRKVDLFAQEILLIPIHLGMHWCLTAVDMDAREISYFDSLLGNNTQCLEAIRDYLGQEHVDKRGCCLDENYWQLLTPKSIPKQQNGSDCGVFTCLYAEHISRRSTFDFSQSDMPFLRKRMMFEIITKEIL